MRKKDSARLDTLGRVIDTLRKNQELFKTFQPLKDRYTELSNTVQELQALRTQLGYSSAGISAEKSQNFETLSRQAVSLAKVGWVWAKSQKDPLLMEVFDVEVSDFSRATEAEAIAMAERIEENLRIHAEDLTSYNITAAKLNNLKHSIAYFRSLKLMPRQHINEAKVQNRQLAKDIKAAMALAEEIECLVIGEYQDSEQLFVDNLLAAMRIYDPATRSTALKLVVLDETGQPIADAVCDVLELEGEEQHTNPAGFAEISGLRSGSYTLEVRKEGFEPQRTSVEIKRGQKLSFNLQLTQNG